MGRVSVEAARMGKEGLLEITEICVGELRELGVEAGVIEEG